MLEMKIKIEVADALISAIDKLASALNITAIPAQAPAPAQPPVQMNAAMTAPTPAPVVPVTAAPTYTLDQIATAGAALVNAGKMEQLLALLGKYGIQAITQLKAEQFGPFVTELRGLGAQI